MFMFLTLCFFFCILGWACKKLSKYFGEAHRRKEEYQSRLIQNLEDIRDSVVSEDDKPKDVYAEISRINTKLQARKEDKQAIEDLIREASLPNT